MKNLEALLQQRDMSQKQFAAEMGVSAPTVSEWISGKKSPSGKNLDKMTRILGCTYDEVLLDKKSAVDDDSARLDDELVSMLVQLGPSEVQRVQDFVAGLLASRTV